MKAIIYVGLPKEIQKTILAKPLYKKNLQPNKSDITKIVEAACNILKVDVEDFYSVCRKREVVYARKLVSYTLYHFGMKLQKISELVYNKKDRHDTVIYHKNFMIDQLHIKDPYITDIYRQFKKEIYPILSKYSD